MIRRKVALVLLIVLVAHPPFALARGSGRGAPGDSAKPLARVGEAVITRGSFEADFARATPDSTKSLQKRRHEFLATLVERQLLVLGARDGGWFEPDSLTERRLKSMGLNFAIERLKDLDIRSKVAFTDSGLEEFHAKQAVSFDMSHILVATEEEGRKVRERLAAGADFAALAEVSLDAKSADKGGRIPPFVWGTTRLLFLRELDAMEPGEVRGPFHTESGYHVIKLNGRIPQPDRQPLSADRGFIERQYRIHLEVEETRAYYQQLRRQYHFTPNWPPANELARLVGAALDAAAIQHPDSTQEQQAAIAMRSLVLTDSLLAQPLAGWDFGRYLVQEGWEMIQGLPPLVLIDRRNPHYFVDEAAAAFIPAAMAHEARRRGLERDPQVQARLAVEQEKLAVGRFYRSEILDRATFTEAEEREYYTAHKDAFRLPARVLVNRIQYKDGVSAEEMEAAMMTSSAEPDSVLAAQERREVVLRHDQGVWFGAAEHPILFERTESLKPGEVARVIDEDGYWSVLVLREREGEKLHSFEESRETIRKDLRQLREDEILQRALGELRVKYPVWIDEEYLGRSEAQGSD